MKKILISILAVLLLALCLITLLKGINIGNIQILSFTQIQEKSATLKQSVDRATVLAGTEYDKVIKDMESDVKKLKEEKKNYEDLVSVSGGNEIQTNSQYQKYEIEYLWTMVGNHATSEGVVIKMDLVAGASENTYNLNFTVNGEYIGITDFISNIENDSALGFKIENFVLTPGTSTSDLQATFTCRDIEIKDVSNSSSKTSSPSTQASGATSESVGNSNGTTGISNTTSTTSTTSNSTSNTVNTTANTASSTNTTNVTATNNTTAGTNNTVTTNTASGEIR